MESPAITRTSSDLQTARRASWWLATALPWVLAAVLLFSEPVYPEAAGWARFSLRQFGLAGLCLAICLVHLGLAAVSAWRPGWLAGARQRLSGSRRTQSSLGRASLGFNLVGLLLFLLLPLQEPPEPLRALLSTYYRLLPVLIAVGIESLMWVLAARTAARTAAQTAAQTAQRTVARNTERGEPGLQTARQAPGEGRPAWAPAGGLLAACLVVWGGMAASGAGLTPDPVGWGEPGIPVLFYQVLVSLLAALTMAVWVEPRLPAAWARAPWLDLLVCLLLWATAVGVWSQQPILRSYFAPPAQPPNFEIYPYSDAGAYAYTAQDLLIGNGFSNGAVVPRPLYILLLAGFYAVAGQDYARVIFVQTLLLAMFPACLYLLGRELHSRPVGLLVAGLAILREVNAILSSPFSDVANSKHMVSDLPTALAVTAFAWLLVRWLKAPVAGWQTALAAGGMLGVTALLRTQALLILPFALAPAAWQYRRAWRRLILPVALFGLGAGLVFLPWLGRNWLKTGQLVMDDPATQTGMIASRYSTELKPIPRLPGENDSAYTERLSGQIRSFMREHPGEVARFVSIHFLHNLATSALILPTRFSFLEPCNTWVVCEPFWLPQGQHLDPLEAGWVLLNLALLAFGMAESWRRWRAVGLAPALIHLAYNLSNAIARNSARRYMLPVDWVAYFYYAVGLVALARLAAGWLGAAWATRQAAATLNPAEGAAWPDRATDGKLALTGLLLLLVGFSLPLAEVVVQPRYARESKAETAARLLALPAVQGLDFAAGDLQDYVGAPNVEALHGRAIYPRFYLPGKGEPGSSWYLYKPYPDGRTGKLGFVLLTPQGVKMACLARHRAPAYFPNASDVIVTGQEQGGCLEVLLVAFVDGSEQVVVSDRADELLSTASTAQEAQP